jgi:hypothetical protein
MKKYLYLGSSSLILFFLFSSNILLSSNNYSTKSQIEDNIINSKKYFNNFSNKEDFESSLCDDCMNDCPYCAEYCWPANAVCNSCKKIGNCPENCSYCSKCSYCLKDGWCCTPWYKGGGSCSSKSVTCK